MNRLVATSLMALALALFSPRILAGNSVVRMTTNHGAITIELNNRQAPLSVGNFLDYVVEGHYDGMIFHRIIERFVIQGGGYAASVNDRVAFQKTTREPIKNDARQSGLSNVRGTIAMARTAEPHSATAQFFINVVDNSKGLDPGGHSGDGYAVFGRVIEGMEVVDLISKLPRGPKGLEMLEKKAETRHRDVPIKPVIIESVRVVAGPRTMLPQPESWARIGERPEPDLAEKADDGQRPSEAANPGDEAAASSAVPHRFQFLKAQADGVVLVTIDFGPDGTDRESTVEWSENLAVWSPLPGADSFPPGTRGVHEVQIPAGKVRAFVRLSWGDR